MALEFPSWLEWLEWLVGSDWPHGNEDRMWRMAQDLEAVAGQVDDLVGELDALISKLGDAYPEGDGGEQILAWLKPLRNGNEQGHGSITELGDHYRALAKAADDMGDQLQSAKLNFYIGGAWLVAELAIALASGPLAPFLEATTFAAGRTFFRLLGEQFASRIMSLIGRRITNPLLRQILPKLIYEVTQEALVETFQGLSQEFLVQTIQQQTGHTDGYDWGAMRDNAIISAVAGATGGAAGYGMNHFLPADVGGWKGALKGGITGATAGAAGAGAAWLAGGMLNGNWDFDPRSLTGGALSGAGPSALHGFAGQSDHSGAPIGSNLGQPDATQNGSGTREAPEGRTEAPGAQNESGAQQAPESRTEAPAAQNGTGTQQAPENRTESPGAHNGSDSHAPESRAEAPSAQNGAGAQHAPEAGTDAPSGQNGSGAQQEPSGTGESEGTRTHAASSSAGDTDTSTGARQEAPAQEHKPEHTGDNSGAVAVDGRRDRPEADPQDKGEGSEVTQRTSGGAHSGGYSGGSDTNDGSHQANNGQAGQNSGVVAASGPPASTAVNAPASNVSASGTTPTSAPSATTGSPSATPTNPASTATPGTPTSSTSTQPTAASGPTTDARANTQTPPAAGSPSTTNPAGSAPTSGQPGGPGSNHAGAAPAAANSPGSGTPGRDIRLSSDMDGTTAKPMAASPIQAAPTATEPVAPQPDSGPPRADHPGSSMPGQVTGQHPDAGSPRTHDASDPADGAHPARESSRDTGSPATPDADGLVPVPVPVDGSAPHHAGDGTRSPTTPSDSRDSGTAKAVGDFHGNARPTGAPDLSPEFVADQISKNLGLITPEGVSWNRDQQHFLLDNGDTVTISIAESPAGAADEAPVAQFRARPGGYDVELSPRARDADVVRAIAHELAEIRLLQDQDPVLPVDSQEDRPTTLTPHLGGRFAELRVLTAQIDQAAVDPARAQELPRLRKDFDDLVHRLGLRDPAHGPIVERLLAEHDAADHTAPESALARRVALEERNLLEFRPRFGPQLSDADYDRAVAEHLNRLREEVSGDFAEDLVRAEQRSLDGRMREELARRIFDPLFEPSTKPARGTVKVDFLLESLDPINAALNDPALTPQERAVALREAIDQFRAAMPEAFHAAIDPEVFARMGAAADAFAAAPNRITAVLDHESGRLHVAGTTSPVSLSDFLREVDRANRAATAQGLNIEYTVVVHDGVNGKSSVEILPRPRPQHRLPLAQNAFGPDNTRIPHQPRPPVPRVTGGHTIDVGVGRSAFAVEMTPAADREGGGLVIKTELASDFAVAGQRRRDLGILDPGPLTQAGTVMVFGDLLTGGHLLTDAPAGEVARIFINNVSADLPDFVYRAIAERLAETLAPGGRVEVQWDMKPEREGGEPGDRNHILGTKLWDAIEAVYRDRNEPNPFRIDEHRVFPYPGNNDYDYTIDAGASNNLNTARMAAFNPPLPEHRMVLVYEPGPDAQEIQSTYGIPEQNQDKIQTYADQHDLVIDVRPTNPDAVGHLQDGAMPKPMAVKDKTVNDADIALGAPAEAKGLVGRFAPGQLQLPDPETLTAEQLQALQKRLTDRENDYRAYEKYMADLIARGDFRVTEEGVLEGRVGDEYRPVTGDHDLFDMRHADGTRLTPEELAEHETNLMGLNAGIQHGPHVYWEPAGEYQRVRNFEKIINEHQPPTEPDSGNEPLIRFRPGGDPEVVWADLDLEAIDREMTPWHLESNLSGMTPRREADLDELRRRAYELANHPDFDHAAYRAWLSNPEVPPADVGSPAHQIAIMKLAALAGTDPSDILAMLDADTAASESDSDA